MAAGLVAFVIPLLTTDPLQFLSSESPEVTAQAFSDPFGIAHISAVNSQSATYSAQRYQQAFNAGARWNRWVFYWHEIESSSGLANYSPQEATVNQDVNNGFRFKIDAILMGTPSWATTAAAAAGIEAPPPRVGQRSYGGDAGAAISYASASSTVYPPQHLDRSIFSDGSDAPGTGKTINQSNYWARFVYNTVLRFKDRVRHWEIWNEPDYYPSAASGYYGFWAGTADQYFRLLKVAYIAARAADPEAVVIMGGMAYWPEIVQQGKSPFTFFKRVLTLAKADGLGSANNRFFDATAWHWYNRSNQSYYKVLDTKNVLTSYGLGAKPIWLNESGMPAWNDAAKPPPGGNEAYFGSGTMTEQAAYVIQSMAYGLAAGVQRNIIFQEYDDGNGEAFGLVRNSGSARAAYHAYEMAARYLSGVTSASLSSQGSAHLVTATPAAGGRVVVMWNNSPTPKTVTILAQRSSATLLRQPTESNLSGSQQTIYPSNGSYSIALPGATDNNGTSSTDYIVGGLAAFLVEGGGTTPTPTGIAFSSGLVANGGFEDATAFSGWTKSGYIEAVLHNPGYSGSFSAGLGESYMEQPGLSGANSTLSQTVALPAPSAVSNLALRFAYFIDTEQPAPSNTGDPYSYDKFEVLLFEADGTRHDLLTDWTGGTAWTQRALDVSAYRGQTVTIYFNVWQSQASASYPTVAYVDDVRIWPFSGSLSGTRKNN